MKETAGGQEWDIRARSAVCSGCGLEFNDGQVCWSRLVFGAEGYARTDYCEPCRERDEDAARTVSVWKGVFRAPPPPPQEPLKKETAESLLRNLMGEHPEAHATVIFILAAMLERKKLLVEREVRIDERDRRLRVYEHRKTGETFVISDPQLRLDQLQEVQEQVMAMLGGVPVEEPPEALPAAPAEPEASGPLRPEDIPDGGFVSRRDG
jgi:hypothetical protein